MFVGNPCDLLTITSEVDALAAAQVSARTDDMSSAGMGGDLWPCADLASSDEDVGMGISAVEVFLPLRTEQVLPAICRPTGPVDDRFNIGVFQEKIHVLLTARVHPGETSGSWIMQVCWCLRGALVMESDCVSRE